MVVLECVSWVGWAGPKTTPCDRTERLTPSSFSRYIDDEQKLCEQQYPEIEDFDFPGKVRRSRSSEAARASTHQNR